MISLSALEVIVEFFSDYLQFYEEITRELKDIKTTRLDEEMLAICRLPWETYKEENCAGCGMLCLFAKANCGTCHKPGALGLCLKCFKRARDRVS